MRAVAQLNHPNIVGAFDAGKSVSADPDAGTTFAWTTRAFGPGTGWINGWAIFLAFGPWQRRLEIRDDQRLGGRVQKCRCKRIGPSVQQTTRTDGGPTVKD